MKSIDILLYAQHADSLHDMANKQHRRNFVFISRAHRSCLTTCMSLNYSMQFVLVGIIDLIQW